MSFIPYGCDGIVVRIEADIRRGIPGMDISGLAALAVREAKERIRVAFRNSGYHFPDDRILINLAPAGVRKDGAALDLPIAAAVAQAMGLFQPGPHGRTLVLGELELSGRVRPVTGVLAATAAALDAGVTHFIVPSQNKCEAEILAPPGSVAGVSALIDAVSALTSLEATGVFPAAYAAPTAIPPAPPPFTGDFAEVHGQSRYKRALEIAAAGGHNLLVFGVPGSGKTMLARRLPSILSPLDAREQVTVTKLHSLAGQHTASPLVMPPFRAPHHSASAEGILGGGKAVRPGEISLAHLGALFLDEAPEFKANVLQALREPLEDKMITIVRAEGLVRLPADFQLILAANPCPCGKLGVKSARTGGAPGCLCSGDSINRYWKKLGGALLDRVELRVPVHAPEIAVMPGRNEEPSIRVAERVRRAIEMQNERYKGLAVRRNVNLRGAILEKYCSLTDNAQRALDKAAEKMGFSGRAYHSVLRTARTIADIEGADAINAEPILEAIQHRRYGDDPYDIFHAS